VADYNYTVFFEPLEKGGYQVIVPAIPEICTFGDTLEDARAMAKEAIRCVNESALKDGEPIAPDADPTKKLVMISIYNKPLHNPALPVVISRGGVRRAPLNFPCGATPNTRRWFSFPPAPLVLPCDKWNY
jgi:antitoxin HicB